MKIFVGRCLLQEILDRRNLSRACFIERTGMSKQQVSNYINGEQFMSLKTIMKVCYVLNCDTLDLYEWEISED